MHRYWFLWVGLVAILVAGCPKTEESPSVVDSGKSLTPIEPGERPKVEPFRPDEPLPANATPDVIPDVRRILSNEVLLVDVMEMLPSQQVQELEAKLLEAEKAKPELRTMRLSGKYDPRIGISAEQFNKYLAQYDEYLAASKDRKLRVKMPAVLKIAKMQDDVYVLDGGKLLPELTEIEIDLKQDQVRTPLATTDRHVPLPVHTDPRMGKWHGARWSKADAERGISLNLGIGRLLPSDRGVVVYDVRQVTPEGLTTLLRVLHFDVPETPTTLDGGAPVSVEGKTSQTDGDAGK